MKRCAAALPSPLPAPASARIGEQGGVDPAGFGTDAHGQADHAGFFLMGNPRRGQGLLHIGRAGRNAPVATVPRGQRWSEDAFELAAVEGINGFGFGERSPAVAVQR